MSYRFPYYLATDDGRIVSTANTGGKPSQTYSVDEAKVLADQMEANAHDDYRAGFCVGAERTMEAVFDLRAAFRALEQKAA